MTPEAYSNDAEVNVGPAPQGHLVMALNAAAKAGCSSSMESMSHEALVQACFAILLPCVSHRRPLADTTARQAWSSISGLARTCLRYLATYSP